MANLSKIGDEKRYYNWYKGYTEIRLPTYNSTNGLTHIIRTTDTSGIISTKYFGNKFNGLNVERKANFEVYIYPSKEIKYNSTVTLHMELKKVSMNNLIDSDGSDSYQMNYEKYVVSENDYVRDFNPPINKTEYGNIKIVK